MRIGLSGGANLDRVAGQLADAEASGFTSMWFAGAIGTDPLTVITAAGRETAARSIELGTSIVQTYPRHPVLMAQEAAAVSAAVGGRFTLGLGVSHRPAIEGTYGLSYERPARHMREYLQVVMPLLAGKQVDFKGECFRVQAQLRTPPPEPVPVLVAALANDMLRAAGELADGTITWMANARAIADHIGPRLRAAAEEAGRSQPRVVVGLPVAVADADAGRQAAAQQFAGYGMLPNYQRVLAAGGAGGPADVAVVGDEDAVARQLRAYIDAGATDIWAAIFPVGDDRSASRRRTQEVLAGLTG